MFNFQSDSLSNLQTRVRGEEVKVKSSAVLLAFTTVHTTGHGRSKVMKDIRQESQTWYKICGVLGTSLESVSLIQIFFGPGTTFEFSLNTALVTRFSFDRSVSVHEYCVSERPKRLTYNMSSHNALSATRNPRRSKSERSPLVINDPAMGNLKKRPSLRNVPTSLSSSSSSDDEEENHRIKDVSTFLLSSPSWPSSPFPFFLLLHPFFVRTSPFSPLPSPSPFSNFVFRLLSEILY